METKIVNFRVSSALKNLIGRELITDNYVAVFELVKNSFDAKATKIDVTIDLSRDKIIVKDNGTGMSLNDVVEKWLFIGYSDKKDSQDVTYSGNKGIGRFSCDRLGSSLTLITTQNGIETSLSINWDTYEENQSKEIQVLPIEVKSQNSTSGNGTFLEIGNLRADWTDKDVVKTKDQLLRLISPNKRDVKENLSLHFINRMGIPIDYDNLYNDVFDYMENKAVYVKSTFLKAIIKTELFDHGRRILTNVSNNNSLLTNASMLVFFSDRNAKSAFKRKTGTDLLNYGNLFIYRNGFRVYPFGELTFDPFGLAERKTQGYNRFLGPREIVGWIDITDKENHFVESTSRDRGFIDNIYSQSLKAVYMDYIHKPLEKYVQLINYGNIDIDEFVSDENAEIIVRQIVKSFEMPDSVQTEVDESFIADKETHTRLNKLIDSKISSTEAKKIVKETQERLKNKDVELRRKQKEIEEKTKENEKLTKEIQEKNHFIDIKNPSRQEALEHDLGLVVKTLAATQNSLFEVNKEYKNSKLEKAIKDLTWALFRTRGIRNFILKTNMDTRTKTFIEVGSFYKEYSTIVDYKKIIITVFVEQEFVIETNVFDLITIFDNVVSNVDSLNGKKIDIYVSKDKLQFITDTYNSVDGKVDFERVFDYGYTTNEYGTGIGMYLIKNICKQLKLDVSMRRVDESNYVLLEIKRNA